MDWEWTYPCDRRHWHRSLGHNPCHVRYGRARPPDPYPSYPGPGLGPGPGPGPGHQGCECDHVGLCRAGHDPDHDRADRSPDRGRAGHHRRSGGVVV